MTDRTHVATVIERINALRERLFTGRLVQKEFREIQRQIVYWRRRLAVLLAEQNGLRRPAAAG